MRKFLIILIICLLALGVFVLAKRDTLSFGALGEIKVSEILEKLKLPKSEKGISIKYPIDNLNNYWQEIGSFFEEGIEEKKSEIGKEFEKEKQEMKAEIPKLGNSLGNMFKALVDWYSDDSGDNDVECEYD